MTLPGCQKIARKILNACIQQQDYPRELLQELLTWAADPDTKRAHEATNALFQSLVERMADLFEPRLCEAYASLFSEAIAFVSPEWKAADLTERYHRIRRVRPFRGDPDRIRKVFVLSRVTLGADIAITSLVLDAVKRRFPRAEIFLAGGEKSLQLFSADPRIRPLHVSYGRSGTLRDRLSIWPKLQALLSQPDSLVFDPDSRLTQLGLLPVCPEENYFFFESRSYGGDGGDSLTILTRRWLSETLAVPDAAPYIAPAVEPGIDSTGTVTVNLGVGENPAKRIPDPFEQELLRALLRRGAVVLIDKGAGNEEAQRVERAIRRCGAPLSQVHTWKGSFAAFAGMIAKSRLYIGYDSSGQHAAAACGTPLVSVFAGFASPKTLARWRPTGAGRIEVIEVYNPDPLPMLERTLAAIDRLGVL